MKRFRFRLEPVQRLREQDEQARRVRLARELAALEELRTAATSTATSLTALERTIVSAPAVTVEELARARAAYEAGARRLRGLRSSVDEQAGAVSAARTGLAEATRAREAVERLHEQARERHTADTLKAESGELDEVSVARWRR